MMTRKIGYVAAVVLSLATIVLYRAHDASAAEPSNSGQCNGQGTLLCPTPTDDGYEYIYDPTTNVLVPVPTGSFPKQPGVTYEYAATPACPLALPGDAVNCTAAAQYCAQNGSIGIHEDIWRREATPTIGPWTVVSQTCTGAGPAPIPVEQVVQDASEYERTHVPIPVPNVQPPGVALVNLPVIVSVPQPEPVTMQVQQPVPGTLVATPTFAWRFDDGATVTGAGTPYDGTDPRVNPAHYVSHTYTAADAHASVTLTVTWNATFTAAGQDFPIPPLTMPPITTTFTVHEAHAVLVSGE
jgi:hypothetical protein